MFKHIFINFAVIFMVTLFCEGTIVRIPNDENEFILLSDDLVSYENEQTLPWQAHVRDFIKLVNVDKILSTTVRFIDDPEVLRFLGFLMSSKLKDIVTELEGMDEFKEAYRFLASKGYDVKDVIDYVNTALNLPSFNKPEEILRSKAGVSEFITAIVETIPVQEMKALLKSKVENYPEVAEFVEVIRSPEFIDIIKRMVKSEKFGEIKSTFESYGVDFDLICEIINEVVGKEYENIFCGHTHVEAQYF